MAGESDYVLLCTYAAMMIAHSLSGGEDIKISTFWQAETPKSNLKLNVSLLNNDDWNTCKMAFASPLSTFKYLKDVGRENMEEWKTRTKKESLQGWAVLGERSKCMLEEEM